MFYKFFGAVILMFLAGAAAADDNESAAEAVVEFTVGDGTRGAQLCRNFQNAQPCELTITAESENCRVRFRNISMTFTVSYTEFGRSDSASITHNWSGDSCRFDLTYPISSEVRGGDVAIRIVYGMTNGQNGTSNKSVAVFAENPTTESVRTEISDLTHAIVLFQRNGLRQFTAQGRPLNGDGFGVGGLETPTASQFWSWKENLAEALVPLEQSIETAREIPVWMRRGGLTDIPDFTPDQLRRQALQSLVGESYYRPNGNGTRWIENQRRSSYADDILAIEAQILAGQPPQGW